MSKNFEEVLDKSIEENKDFLKNDPEWDDINRRSPNILIAKLIEFTAKKYPSFRLNQIFLYYDIDLKNNYLDNEPKQIWDFIQRSENFNKNIEDFINFLSK